MIINPYIFGVASTLNTGLFGVWNADNTPNDSFGSNNGTLINGATYATGKINEAFSFDGVNDYLSLPVASINLLNTYSISLWVKSSNIGANGSPISNLTGAPYYGYVITLYAGAVYFDVYNNSSAYRANTANILSNNIWYHIVVVFQAGSPSLIYVNGSSSSITSNNTINPTYQGTEKPSIGIQLLGAALSNPFLGLVDTTTIWTRVLTPAEVTELYNLGTGKQYPY